PLIWICAFEPSLVLIGPHPPVRSRASGNPGPLASTTQYAALGPRFRGDERPRGGVSTSSEHAPDPCRYFGGAGSSIASSGARTVKNAIESTNRAVSGES